VSLSVYVTSEQGDTYPIPEIQGEQKPNAAGSHRFHFYALDILGSNLSNGTYTIVADAYDASGQHIRRRSPIKIEGVGATGIIIM